MSTGVIKVRDTAIYEAIHSRDEAFIETAKEWIPQEKEFLENPEQVETLIDSGAWLLRHPSGQATMVHPADFAAGFEEVEDIEKFS